MADDIRSEHDDLVRLLQSRGFELTALLDWIAGPTPPEAVPYLIEALGAEQRTDGVREIIARALTDRRFKAAAPALLQAFTVARDKSALWSLGNALATVGFPKVLWPEILSAAADPRYGDGRQMIVWRLHRIKHPDTISILETLVAEHGVDAFAVIALGYAGTADTLNKLAHLSLEGRSVLFKREVPKAIKRLKAKLGV
jgi:HEAT repeat protein